MAAGWLRGSDKRVRAALHAVTPLRVIVHASQHFDTSNIQHHPRTSYLLSNTSIASPTNPRKADKYLRPIPARVNLSQHSSKAAQPAIMKPVVSAFNAWTWYVAVLEEATSRGKRYNKQTH